MMNHTNCSHPATSAARKACRNGNAAPAATTTAPARKPRANYVPAEFDGPKTKLGFPLALCSRCGGTGQYPSPAWRGVCLGCSGTGTVDYNRSSRRQRLAYELAVREQQTTPISELAVGDRVLVSLGMMGNVLRFETIESIELREGHCGSVKIGDVETVWDMQWNVSTKNSGLCAGFNKAQGSTHTMRRWNGRVDPAPYLAKITV